MPTERQGALAGSTGSRCRIFYIDGSNWNEVPGIGSVDFAPSTRSTATYSAFEGAFSTTGALEIGAVTFEVASFLPNHPAWKFLDSKFNNNDNIQLRVETNENDVFNSGDGTVSIATNTGLCTFAGGLDVASMSDVARGHQIVTGTDRHTITKISNESPSKFYVEPPASAVNATKFRVVFPILQWLVTGKLSSSGGASIAEDAANSSQFIVQPSGRVQLPTAVNAHTEGISA